MTKKIKLPTIKKPDNKPFQIRLSDDEKAKAMEARAILKRSIGQMFREALFNYYLPYHYSLGTQKTVDKI